MWQELRYGLRRLGRNPLVSVTVAITLAVGIGAVTTAFTLVRAILSPLDYPQAEGLVRMYETLESLKGSPNPRLAAMWNQVPVSYQNVADWRRGSRTLAGIGRYLGHTAVLDAGDEPLEVSAAKIDAELLRVLGVAPALGRPFSAQEVERRALLVLLGHDLWTSVFGADETILGRAVRLDGQQVTVVGVMPAGFALPGRQDGLWTPAGPTEEDLAYRDEHAYTAIGRLAPEAALPAAQTEMDRLASLLAARYPDTNAGTGVRLAPLLDTVIGDSRRVVVLLFAAAAVVFLVACVNLAHLLFAQGMERQGEMALRLSLGAGRARLFRQSAVEALILAAAGIAGGLLLAALARRALPLFLATELPRLEKVAVDWGVAGFAISAGLVAILLSSLLPAALVPGAAPREAMAGGRLVRVFQDVLIVAEIALTLMLTAGAMTLATSWLRLAAVDPGLDAKNVLVQELRLPSWQYPDEVRRAAFAARLLAGLESLPGASGAALTSRLPVPGPAEVWGFRIAGRDVAGGDWTQGRSAVMQLVTPAYFRVLRIPLVAGKPFASRPGPGPARVVMVNRTLAQRHWPGTSPVGAEVTMREQGYRVEGIFGDIRHQGLAEDPGELMVQPWEQGSPAAFAALVRVDGNPLDLAAAVRRTIRRLDPALPLPPAALLEDLVAGSVVGPRSRALLVGLSAGIALLLALVGTYGVMAYGVGRRRREIAVRMVAGADSRWVQRWVLRRSLALALAGVSLGVLGALAARRLLEGLLYGVAATDARSLLAAAFLLTAACLAAAYLPARRASRVDPASALRSE